MPRRRPVACVCIGCSNVFETLAPHQRSYCSNNCYQLARVKENTMVKTIASSGLTRYTVRALAGGYVVWDTETSTRASRLTALSVASDRALALERLYGTRSATAA